MSGRIYDNFYQEEIKCCECSSTTVRRSVETNFNGFYCIKCKKICRC
jgi:hypothetical protein